MKQCDRIRPVLNDTQTRTCSNSKLSLVIEKMKEAQNCDIHLPEMVNEPESKTVYTDNLLLDRNDTFEADLVTTEYSKELERELTDDDSLEEVQIFENIPVVNDPGCIQIETNNLITITEDQLVKIEYQNANGIINTEYIVNDEIFNVQINNQDIEGNYVNFLNVPDALYQDHQTDTDGEMPETNLDCTDPLQISEMELEFDNENKERFVDNSKQHLQSVLSPQSEEDNISETDLTSLNWLHNITNIMAVPNLPTPPVSPKPKKKTQNSSQEDLTININFYKKNGDKKPPFSYATLICMAMGKNGNKMTLSAIYHWIRENFLYYRKAHPSWQVSLQK